MASTLVAMFLQGATPVLITAGGRLSGIAPAYALLIVGLCHFVIRNSRRSEPGTSAPGVQAPLMWLCSFTVIGVLGALFLPRLFEGVVVVLPPAFGLDTAFVEPVRPSGRNLIQAFYLICNVLLFYLCSWAVRTKLVSVDQCVRGIGLGVLISASLGLYQVLGFTLALPWPAAIINSNLGLGQGYVQTAFGIIRMSATFLEPSLLAFHFLSVFALFGLGLHRWWLGALIVFCLLLSLSSSAYIGLLILLPFALIISGRARERSTAVIGLLIFGALAVSAYVVDQIWTNGDLFRSLVVDKLDTTSGLARTRASWVGWNAFLDSWGLGVGIGSIRVSGLPLTLAATVGLPGMVCLAGFMVTLLRMCLATPDKTSRAFALGLIAVLLVWVLAVPDLSIAYAWALTGLAHGIACLQIVSKRANSRSLALDLGSELYGPTNANRL